MKNTAAILFFLIALTALVMDIAGVRVHCPQCVIEPTLGLLGRSWFLWGALYYAVIGFAASFRKNTVVPVVVAAGIVFHFWLIGNGFYGEKVACPICYGFLVAEIVALAVYLIVKQPMLKHVAAWVNTGALLLVVAIWFSPGQPTYGSEVQAESGTDTGETVQTASVEQPQVESVTDLADEHMAVKDAVLYPVVQVTDEFGLETKIDLSKRPALYFAWWHPRTAETLKVFTSHSEYFMPYFVSVQDRGKKEYAVQILSDAGIKGHLYFTEEAPAVIPALVWYSDGRLNISDPVSKGSTPPVLFSAARISSGGGSGANNAVLAATAINGTVIPPGGVFSFNQTVGQRTPERGYLPSEVIVSGPDGPERAEGVGGGICRTATVLHQAVKSAGLEVMEASRHSLPVSYGDGDDVAVAWPDLDYKFRNTSGVHLKIVMQEQGGVLVAELFAYKKGDTDVKHSNTGL